ncbi:uncharacterized protein LOC118198644 [Stegodyphus dumicola]|uniref:uncharacterized protein LOC118198644 n=1 Tax=Stegodyphus dumicola TaxID=202533 RepID=UPI0015AC4926|nr:uncharacterized protein LOC118198644 [Stegodyphus dumicola]
MFSSLPSATKIYVNANKTRQKHSSSTKKKRKNVVCTNFASEVGAGVDTLIASSIEMKEDDDFSSGKDTSKIDSPDRKFQNFSNDVEKELSFEKTDKDKIYIESNNVHFFNSSSVPFADNIVDKIECGEGQNANDEDKYVSDELDVEQLTQATNELHDSQCINQDQLFDMNVDEKKNIISNDLCSRPVDMVSTDQQVEDCIQECQSSNVFDNDDPKCLIYTTDLSKDSTGNEDSSLDVNQNVPELVVEAVLPTICDEDESAVLNEGFHTVDFDLKSPETDTSILVDFDNSHYEKSDITLDDSLLSVQFNDLTKNLSSDSASVRSDCCLATNIYDERTELIEYENTSDQEEHCIGDSSMLPQMQSPEQSELSCTESARSENKNGDTVSESSVSSGKPDTSTSATTASSVVHEHQKNGTTTSKDIDPRVSSDGSLYCKNILPFSEIFSHSLPNLSIVKERAVKFQCKSLSHLKKASNFSDKSTVTTDIQYFCENSRKECESCQSSKKEFKFANEESVEQKTNSVDSLLSEGRSSTFKSVSSTVTKLLPPVAMMQARSRSYVFGSIGPSGSLLGNEELLRFFPDKKVSIFMGTWNMNGHVRKKFKI